MEGERESKRPEPQEEVKNMKKRIDFLLICQKELKQVTGSLESG